jgi:WhiB family redox-sensing transcriptional regulator
MVLYDPHRRWAPRGICRWEDRELFFAEAGMNNRRPAAPVQALWDQAKEICSMCPVLRECRRDTLGEPYGVFGGLDSFERYQIRRHLTRAIRTWPEERRLKWAREIYRLRKAKMHWRTIQTQTGIPQSAGELLVEVWEEHLKQVGKQGQVVDLELPDLPKEPSPFPDRRGRRHAWVRHRGIVSDAWYRGETPDGEWVAVTTEAGRGQVHKWVHKDDVHLYRPQPVVILNYVGRPDHDDSRTPAA